MPRPSSSNMRTTRALMGASVRQVLLNELVDSSTEVTIPMAMQGQVEEGWTLVQPKQTYRKAIRLL